MPSVNVNTSGVPAADVLARLPSFYRESRPDVAALVEAAAASLGVLRESLDDHGPETLDSPRVPGSPRLAAPSAAGFRKWLGKKCGEEPTLWPGVRLEEHDDGTTRSLLRVRLGGPRRRLAVLWRLAPDSPADGHLRVVREMPAVWHPPGLEVQFAAVGSDLPRNLCVEGLVLEGKLLESWQ